ncbi:MAG: Do family serine endopeptidase [Rhodobacterales bacterium]|nr:Do family serine endopeptidase [Rhodobacterales bacterium]
MILRTLAPVLALSLMALAPVAQAETRVPESAADISLSFAPVVRAAAPAVVNIYATRLVEDRRSPFAADPFFRQFFGDLPGLRQQRAENSLGSGVIVSGDGLVVSNYHVVGEASDIRVVLADRREYAARVVLGDEASDLAVLQIEGLDEPLPTLAFRDSDTVEVGDLVLAIGNPFGVGQTVSSGIISGLARSGLAVGDGRGYFLQTDAAINPGNSGGALVDVRGRLVGINTAILSRSGGSQGIGFAIPANLVQSVVAQARAGADRFQRPWAGVNGQPVDQALAEALGLDRPRGVVLTEVHPDSPFAAAGLRPGDVILSLGGEPANTPQEVIFRLAALGVGGRVKLSWLRKGRERQADVALIAAPDRPDRQTLRIRGATPLAGLTVARVNPAVIAEFGLPLGAQGVVVTAAEGVAARVGLQPGDILLSINGDEPERPADVDRAAQRQVRVWAVDVLRGGKALRLRFRI